MIRKKLKTITLFGCALLVCGSVCAAPSFAITYSDIVGESTTASTEVCAPMVKKTEWRYRNYNGHLQRRLWSVDSGKWLTEWEDC